MTKHAFIPYGKKEPAYYYPYYDTVCQVKYLTPSDTEYNYGIAYHNTIIDSKDGHPVDIQKLFSYNNDCKECKQKYYSYDELIVELSWNDITNVIKEKQ